MGVVLEWSGRAAATLLVLAALAQVAEAGNCTDADATKNCIDGLIVPIWRPFLDLSSNDRLLRGVIYFIVIAYCFIGVSIVADRFMSGIEVITSQERTITVKRPGLEPMQVKVRVWNDTVSNLTLMALGSSAPEILLSIIEILARKFEAGDLGPNTIVGSAAFNLFMITAICVLVIPKGEVRRQKHLDVFFVTASWSIFAYIWMYLILAVISPGVIDVWEGVVTFLFFPLTVLTAFIADIKIIQNKFLPKRYRRSSHGLIATEGEEMKMLESNGVHLEHGDPAIKAFEDHRQEFIELMREIRKKNPHIAPADLQKQAEYEMISRGPKSRAFYRVQATRRLIGGGDIVKKRLDKQHDKALDALLQAQEKQTREHSCRIFFDPAHYTVLENVGTFDVVVGRDGGPEGLTIMVDYYTEDGTAESGSDYVPVKGTLTFYPEDKHQKISIEIVDDDVFEEDEHFYLHLKNLRVRTKDGLVLDPTRIGGLPVAQLEMPATATIMVLDDDHAGVFSFEHDHYEVVESCGYLSLKVQRHSGARGKVIIPYRTIEGSASSGKHFEAKEGELVFEDNQTEAFIELGIVDTEQYERSDSFQIEIDPPIWAKKMNGRIAIAMPICCTHLSSTSLSALLYPPPLLSSVVPGSVVLGTTLGLISLLLLPSPLSVVSCLADLAKVQERFRRRMERRSVSQQPPGEPETPGRSQSSGDLLTVDDESTMITPRELAPNINERFRRRMSSWIAGMNKQPSPGTNHVSRVVPVSGSWYPWYHGSRPSGFSLYSNTLGVFGGRDACPTRRGHSTKNKRGGVAARQAAHGQSTAGGRTGQTSHWRSLQNVIDRMIKNANTKLMLGTSSWREQFKEALTVNAGDDDDDDEEGEEGEEGSEKIEEPPSCFDYFMHIITVPWKLLFATIPPTDYWGGWACFVVSIAMIGVLTALVGDLASQFGCWVGLKDSVTAISFVALGTSVPDTFASKVSAVQDKYADNSIGNVTGSNAVNVFLGIGIAWSMAAIYHMMNGNVFRVDPGNLGFSVMIFCCEAAICIFVIVLRRHKKIGGELGGPMGFRYATSMFFCSLWFIYLLLSALEAYCIIPGF
ncbi:ncx-2 [Pristionchus pacificus]|uniref:Ncx-2 n=1 Tax=Pristionchus pacificus TaxID=54126 RepID=A0A2A6C0Y6_PRIPA|nr:ncx-2 [Pristionchus pacificus]|eukprot:PDM71691.1 ncx-2 [Pristionchus pacificus]